MAYPPPPGTSSLPARPPVSAAAPPARSGFKPAFNSISQPAAPPAPSYATAPPSRAAGPTYPGAPPSSSTTTAQYASSSYNSYGGGGGGSRAPAAPLSHHQHHSTAPSYQYPQQRQGYGAHQHQHQHQYQQHQHQHSQHSQYQHQQQQQHSQHQHHQPQHHQQQHAHQGYGQQAAAQYSAAPQIRNPFPTPGPGGSDFDPEMAAQIAQWQSAYVPRETDKDGRPTAGAAEYPRPSDMPDPAAAAAAAAAAAGAQSERKKTVVREGGGKKWRDDSLLEWDPSHLRLFVGNLAGETTDESLLKAFSRWRSVQKARVIRDKRTTKSKGFGFVSFSDADDFFQAAKEMNGKYIQSHPVVVKKATTEIKVTNAKDKDRNRHGRKNNGHGGGGGGQGHGGGNDKRKGHDQAGGGYEPYMGPMAGGGVTKPGQKTKNGLRLLG